MKEVAAYLLAVLGGNTSPTVHDLKAILASVGADGDDDMLELLLSNVKGKDISELIASGKEKMASVLSGCVACGGGDGGGSAVEVKKVEKIEEKKEEKVTQHKEEESDDEPLFSLFD